MTRPARGLAIEALCLGLVVAACAPESDGRLHGALITADTVDAALEQPGTVLRFGPATPEEIARPLYAPIVEGDHGQVSIYRGFFVREPCALPLRVDASLGVDTITLRVVSEPDTARADTCQEGEHPTGYAVLVGQFEPDVYAVRVVHEGDRSRPAPLDTVYENITVAPRER